MAHSLVGSSAGSRRFFSCDFPVNGSASASGWRRFTQAATTLPVVAANGCTRNDYFVFSYRQGVNHTKRAAGMILGALSLAVTAVAADFTGTWKVNLAKSKPGDDLAGLTMKIEQTGPNAYRVIIDRVLKSGGTMHQEVARVYDGKEHPAIGTGFNQDGATEICEQIDSLTRKVTQKKNGTEISEFTSTLSPDDKMMSNVRKVGWDETLVLERQ